MCLDALRSKRTFSESSSRLDKCAASGIKRVMAVSKRGPDSGDFLQTPEESELRVKAGCTGCSVMRIEI